MLSHFSHVQLSGTLWTVACQAPLSMGWSKQEYWSGLPYPPLGDLPNPGIEPASLKSPAWQVGSLPLASLGKLKNWGASKLEELWIYTVRIIWRVVLATLSSILVWRTPWTEEPGGLSPWGCKESDTTEQLTLSSGDSNSEPGLKRKGFQRWPWESR